MPGLTRLQEHGMLFEHAFTKRVHVLTRPLDTDVRLLPGPARREVHAGDGHAPAAVPAGRVVHQLQEPGQRSQPAGDTPVYKGKFDCNKPANGSEWVPEDVNKYGFTGGTRQIRADQSIPEEGGGSYDNDGRFMNSEGTPEAGTEGAVQYLRDMAPSASHSSWSCRW